MATAQKKVNKESEKKEEGISFMERKELVEKEIQAVLDKYRVKLSLEMVYARQGTVPRLVLNDLDQENAEENSGQ